MTPAIELYNERIAIMTGGVGEPTNRQKDVARCETAKRTAEVYRCLCGLHAVIKYERQTRLALGRA